MNCKCEDCYIDCEVLNPRQKTTSVNWEMCYDEDCEYCASMMNRVVRKNEQ